MEHLDLRKNYDSKELARAINEVMKEIEKIRIEMTKSINIASPSIEELKTAINQKVDYSEYRFDPIFHD